VVWLPGGLTAYANARAAVADLCHANQSHGLGNDDLVDRITKAPIDALNHRGALALND
jgi:hypothetical protein